MFVLFLLSLSIVKFSVAAEGPKMPNFSWGTLPVYIHMCNQSGPFTDIDFVSKFPVVTVEKGQGQSTHQPSQYAEDNIVAALRQVKEKDPSVYTIAYLNSVLDWQMYRFHDILNELPQYWAYHTDPNSGKRVPTRSHGDHSFPQPSSGMLSVNFSLPDGRALWASQCTNMTDTGYVVMYPEEIFQF